MEQMIPSDDNNRVAAVAPGVVPLYWTSGRRRKLDGCLAGAKMKIIIAIVEEEAWEDLSRSG